MTPQVVKMINWLLYIYLLLKIGVIDDYTNMCNVLKHL